MILQVLDAFRPWGATWSGQVISFPPGPSGGPSKTHLLPGAGVPRVHRARSPVPPRLPRFATPRSMHQCAAVAAGAYPLRRGAGATRPVLLACRQWDPLGLARRLPSLGVGAWRSAPLLPWRVQCPVRVSAALAAGSGGSRPYLVLCLSRFPLPAPRVPRCVWRAVLSGCPLPSLAGTPFHAVCAFRELGPVAVLVVPACPLPVCALALPRRPPPPLLGDVTCAPRAVPALGAGRAVPRDPCPSACPALVPCSVWRASGGAVRSRFPPTWLGAVRPPWGGSVAFVCRGAGWGGGGRAPCPLFVRTGGPVGRGVALPRSVPLPSLGRQQSGCHWRRSGHGGRGPQTAPVRAHPPSLGAICAASWRRLACSPRFLWEPAAGAGGRAVLRLPSRVGGGGTNPPASGGWGPAPPRLAGWGGDGGGLAPRPPCSPSWGRPAVPLSGPPLIVGALPPGVRVRSGSQGRPGGGGAEVRPVDRSPGGPFRPEPSLCPPRVGNGHGGGHGGRGPHTVLVRRRVPRRGLVRALLRRAGVGSPVGRDPRGSRQLEALGRAVCRSSHTPPPRVAIPSGGGGASPRLRGGGGSLLWPSSWGGERGGGGGGRSATPRPPRPVGRRPAIRCLRCAPPGYTRAVGVAGRPWASGAARLAANGSVRAGGGGGNPSPWFAPPPSPGRPLKGLFRLRRPGRRRSAVGRQRAGREREGGSPEVLAAAAVPPHPGRSSLFEEAAVPPSLRSASVRSWA